MCATDVRTSIAYHHCVRAQLEQGHRQFDLGNYMNSLLLKGPTSDLSKNTFGPTPIRSSPA